MSFRLFLVACCVGLSLSACASEDPPRGEITDPARVLTGVIVAIDGRGFDDIEGFTLRAGGTNHEILIDEGREYSFELGHLHAHLQGSEPVKVTYEERDGELIALTIEDA